MERRQWGRRPASALTSCQLAKDGSAAAQPAQVWDVSFSGIGLLVERPISPGVLLHVAMPPVKDGAVPIDVLTCIVHSTRWDDDAWLLGCSFIRELTTAELRAFLSNQAKS